MQTYLFNVDSVPIGFITCLLGYGIVSIFISMLSSTLNQIFQDRVSIMLVLLLLSAIGALCGGFVAGTIAPKRGIWGVLLLVLNLVYRCYVEFIGIATVPSPPGSFWLPTITTILSLLMIPAALLWSVRYASLKRLKLLETKARS